MLRLFRTTNHVVSTVLLLVLSQSHPCRGADSQKTTAVEAAARESAQVAAARATVKAAPSNAPARLRLGDALFSGGLFAEALQEFDAALLINPRSHEAKTGRGATLVRLGRLKEAEGVLLEALSLNPNPVRTLYELGLLYQKLGDFEKAITHFKEGIKKHEQGRM